MVKGSMILIIFYKTQELGDKPQATIRQVGSCSQHNKSATVFQSTVLTAVFKAGGSIGTCL